MDEELFSEKHLSEFGFYQFYKKLLFSHIFSDTIISQKIFRSFDNFNLFSRWLMLITHNDLKENKNEVRVYVSKYVCQELENN